jgi:RNA polymerase sigma-70 factor (ECF subfamily)
MTMPDLETTRPGFTRLIEQHSGEIFAYLCRQLGGAMDAEDCLQETLLRAYRAFHRTKPDSNYRAWLYKIATNVARTHSKRRNRRAANELPLNETTVAIGDPPDHSAEIGFELARVRKAVEALPEKQRAALILRKYQALDYDAIGEVIDCSPESARANVYQALRNLRSMLVESRSVKEDE